MFATSRPARVPRARAGLLACAPLVSVLLAACGGAPRPATTPAPVPAPVAEATIDAAPRATVPRAGEALPAGRPAAVAVAHEHSPGVSWDLEVHQFEGHERVQHYVQLFSGRARTRFEEWLSRGTRYDGMIRTRLRAAGLPEDLYYLALVESQFDPHAVSHAGATGMWQFMAPTARQLGLRVDWWVDERRDPVRATDAAARMLRWLRGEYGSTFVAAAGYNAGPTRITRGLTQLVAAADSSVGEARFFALAERELLRAETSNYVPQLIAAALVAKDSGRYHVAVRRRPTFTYDSVHVPALMPLAAVARAAGASRDDLLDLNPQVLRGLTPPGAPTLVRLPPGAADGFAARLAALDEEVRTPFRTTVTRRRETPAALAERLDVRWGTIEAFNHTLERVARGKWKGRLVEGQPVRVPTAAVRGYARGLEGEASGLPALPAPAPVAERKAEERVADAGEDATPAKAPKAVRGGTGDDPVAERVPSRVRRSARDEAKPAARLARSERAAGDDDAERPKRPRSQAERDAEGEAEWARLLATRATATRAGKGPATSATGKEPRAAKADARPATRPALPGRPPEGGSTKSGSTTGASTKDASTKEASPKDAPVRAKSSARTTVAEDARADKDVGEDRRVPAREGAKREAPAGAKERSSAADGEKTEARRAGAGKPAKVAAPEAEPKPAAKAASEAKGKPASKPTGRPVPAAAAGARRKADA